MGVKPMPCHKLTAKALAEGLNQLGRDTQIKVQAEALGAKIQAEQGVQVAVQAIEKLMS